MHCIGVSVTYIRYSAVREGVVGFRWQVAQQRLSQSKMKVGLGDLKMFEFAWGCCCLFIYLFICVLLWGMGGGGLELCIPEPNVQLSLF